MKETIRRAFRTFVQTAIGYIVTNIAILSDPETLQNTDILKTTIIDDTKKEVKLNLEDIRKAGGLLVYKFFNFLNS